MVPDGHVGIGSYGSTVDASFDYFLVLQAEGAGSGGGGSGGGGGSLLVDDQFDDGSTSGWTGHGGAGVNRGDCSG